MSGGVAITGVGVWIEGFPSASSWARGVRDEALPRPAGRGFDRVNRRRAGALGRAIADAATEALEQAGADAATVPTIVGSAIGEASTMIGLLEQMWRTKEPMSPAAFTVSVHNAASGLLSISNKNVGYATSLAADEDTPAAALLEGVGLVLDRVTPVLVVCADEPAPVSLVKQAIAWDLLAAAVVLAPLELTPEPLATLEVFAAGEATLAPPDVGRALAHNPQIGLLDLVHAVQRRRPGRIALDRGSGLGYLAQVGFGARE